MSYDTEQVFRSQMEWNLINEALTKPIDPAVNEGNTYERQSDIVKKTVPLSKADWFWSLAVLYNHRIWIPVDYFEIKIHYVGDDGSDMSFFLNGMKSDLGKPDGC